MPVTRLLGPTDIAVPPFSKLIPAELLLITLVWTPTTLPARSAWTPKFVLERTEVFVRDATLWAVPCTLTPPPLKEINESLMKAWPPNVLLARLTPFCVKCRIEQRTI